MKTILDLWNSLSEGWQTSLLFNFILPALGAICWFLWYLLMPNRDFFKLIEDFQEKLPPQHKRAKEDSKKFVVFTVIDTSEMKTHLTTQEIDLFVRRLETFKYHRIVFGRKAIESFSRNLQRLIRTSSWEKFGLALVQKILEEKPNLSSKPYLFGYRIGKYLGF